MANHSNKGQVLDFKQLLAVLKRRWRSVAAVFVLAVSISAVFTFIQKPQFESRSQVFIGVDVKNVTDTYAAAYFASNRAASYAYLVDSTELANRVIGQLGLEMTAQEFADHIEATVAENTSAIDIVVTTDDPDDSRLICDEATEQFADVIADLESGGEGGIVISESNEASLNRQQVSPLTVLNLVVGAIIGLLLGIGLAVAREMLDRTIRTAEHVTDVVDAPVLASIGFDSGIKSTPLLTDIGGFAPRTEAFRLLRTNLQFIDLDKQPRCLVITSAVPGEGKTMTSTNLAVALAQTGRSTLIVDADLRRPRVATVLGLDPAIGMTTALVGRTEIQDAIQLHAPSGLHVLASGAKPPNPTEILGSKITRDLIDRLRKAYDMVIIDAPPLLPVADAAVLSRLADGTIIVVRHGKTTRDQVADAVARVQQVGGRIYGVVVNMVAKRALGSYYYYYYEETAPVSQANSQSKNHRKT